MARRRSRQWSQKPAMKPQQILESSCWDRIELSLGDPDKLFLQSGEQIFGTRICDGGDVADEENRCNA
jgi:hypothetical protein